MVEFTLIDKFLTGGEFAHYMTKLTNYFTQKRLQSRELASARGQLIHVTYPHSE